MLTTPSILNGSISLSANPATLVPLQTTLPVKFPVTFAGVNNLQILTGTFIPSNNTQVMVAGLAALSPNFILLMCDGVANLSSNNGMLTLVPINKVFMATLTPIVGGANPIDSLILSGLAANPYPMAQGQALNYTLVYGQALIS